MTRINQSITLADGRELGFAEFGLSSGIPVFFFHGSASSRLDRPASEEMLIRIGIRFLTVDRPGHGLSSFQPDRRLLDWPGDIDQLADHLKIPSFYVIGHSAGGPHALACAHQLPKRVKAAAVVSGAAPMGRTGAYVGMPLLNLLLAWSARQIPWVAKVLRTLTRDMVMGDVEKGVRRLMASIPEADKFVLNNPENVEIMVASIQEGFRQGAAAVALDDSLVNREWGFALTEIGTWVEIWQGEQDVNVPAHAGRYLAELLPNNRATFLPSEGHFFILSRWEEILETLVGRM